MSEKYMDETKCNLKKWYRSMLSKDEKREGKKPCDLCSLNDTTCPYKEKEKPL